MRWLRQLFGRNLENLGIRFAALDIFHGYDRLEKGLDLRQAQNQIEILARSTRTDGLFERRCVQTFQQSLCSRQQGNALSSSGGPV